MRTLLVVHGFPPAARGGTELYAAAHAAALAERHGDEVLVLTGESDPSRSELAVREEHREGCRIAWLNRTFRDSTSIEDAWRAPHVARAIEPIVDGFAPDAAHVHHLTCLSTLVPQMLAARGVPVTATLHDYWLMCHRGQLLGTDLERCEGPGAAGCARCIDPAAAAASGPLAATGARVVRRLERAAPSVGPLLRSSARAGARAVGGAGAAERASAARVRHVLDEVVPHVALFYAPSAHMRDRFVRFGIPAARIRVSPYGLDPPHVAEPRSTSTGPLRIGFVGSLMVSKAPHLAMQAVASLPAGAATLDVCGAFAGYHGDGSYASVVERHAACPAVRMHGALAPEGVATLLPALDVLVVPSIWEENSPFVILEAFRSGVVVVASRIGGIPELVEDGVNGLLVEPADVDGLARALSCLAEDRALLARLSARCPPVRALDDAVAEMRSEHVRLLTGRAARRVHAPEPGTTAAPGEVTAVVLHHGSVSETAMTVRALRASEPPLARIVIVNNDETPGALDLGTVGVPVEVIVNGRNRGFSGGMNVGIRRALADGADSVLLVNSDVIVPPDAIPALARAAAGGSRVGVAGPVVLARERPDVITSRGIRFNRTTGRVRTLDVGQPHGRTTPDGPRRVDAVNGAVLLVTREACERAGLLDEAYFFSFEEVDLCARVTDAGLGVVLVEDAVVYHRGGASLDPRSVSRFYYGTRNQLRLADRAGRRAAAPSRVLRSLLVLAFNVAHALTAPGGRRLPRLAAVGRGARDYARGRFGPESRPR